MYRTILCAAILTATIFAIPAKADETLKFRVVQYQTRIQFQQIGDVSNHVQGTQRLPGIASFPDGSTAKTLVLGTFDGTNGSAGSGGVANGYENIVFSDGSELWWKWSAPWKIISQTENAQHIENRGGTIVVTGGKGRYAGAKGDGTYEGFQDRIGPAIPPTGASPSDVFGVYDLVVNIKK